MKPTIAIVGAGRAGAALATALHDAGYRITAVWSRRREGAETLAAAVGASVAASPAEAANAADLTLLTVPDSAIAKVAASLARAHVTSPAVVHCCAAMDREVLAPLRRGGTAVGAMHPLQALTGAASASLLRGALFAVDTDEQIQDAVTTMVADLGGVTVAVRPEDRAIYHAAASLAGNAPLALLATAADLLTSIGADPAAASRGLAHLLGGAAANAERLADAAAALTGPVVRDDADTVRRHLDALADADPQARDLYLRMAIATLDLAGRDTHPQVAALLAAIPVRVI